MKVEVLGSEQDKTGCNLIIKRSRCIAFSPAYTLYVKQTVELIENGHGYNYGTWNDDSLGIIWAENTNDICGMFCYNTELVKSSKTLYIQLTGVAQAYRNRGIHTILNKYFEMTAVELGCHVTVATVSPKNLVRLVTCEKDRLSLRNVLMYRKI